MKAQTAIVTLLLATLLTGCGVKKEDHLRVLTELEETKHALEQSQSEVSKFKEKLATAERESARFKSELSSASLKVNELMAEVDRLKSSTYAFKEAGRIADSGDLHGALRAYTKFIQDFPSSPHVSAAKTRILEIEAQAEHERLKELAERISNGALTPLEWAPILRSRSMQEVRDLLGPASTSFEDGMAWVYYHRFKNPLAGNVTSITIYFGNDGKVQAFSGGSSGTKYRP